MSEIDLAGIGYLLAAICFILGLKDLARPRTAVRGNLVGAVGMLLAVVVTLADRDILHYGLIAAAVVIGGAIGAVMAVKVRMTGMPQLVALLNGFGGGASVLVGAASFLEAADLGAATTELGVPAAATVIIGSVTLTGSALAFAKLQELPIGSLRQTPAVRALNVGGMAVCVALGAAMVARPGTDAWLWLLAAAGLVLGLTLVAPIGGADMPVIIALLNSLSGLAAAASGFVLGNTVLIVAGSLVGASGVILTGIMCRAMNRSLYDVVFGTQAPGAGGDPTDAIYEGRVRSTSAEEVAMILDTASRVVIVPGYGMAVAQAQHAVRDLTRTLEANGCEVVFAIHPVAGRMPGHMNVLLAEAEIPYDQLVEMDEVNPTFDRTDVAIVIGANDVVNPVARDPGSAIGGMPILDVDRARTVVVIKRSLSPGFAGIPNPLFAADNTLMLFGDGREAVVSTTRSLGELQR